MIKIIQSYQTKTSVIAIHSDKDAVYFTDCDGLLHTVSRVNWTRVSKPLMLDSQPELHRFQKGSSFSQNGHVAFSTQHEGKCALCLTLPTLETQEIELEESAEAITFSGHDQRAEIVSFCGAKGEYLFTGGTDGRVYMHSTQSGKILMSLKPKPEFISNITVDNKGALLSYSAHDKSIVILNIRLQKEYLNTILDDTIEHSFFYNNSKSFYAIGRDGNSYTCDLKSKDISKKALFPSWPNCCVIDASGRFAIVGARNGTIYVVKLIDNSMFSSFQLDQKGVSSLYIDNNYLFIGFENGWIYMVDMHAFIDDFSQAITIKDFKIAKRCLDKNLFLAIHPMSEMFQEAWEEMLREIINQFSTGNAAAALEFAEPFLTDEEHKREFNSIMKKQKEFEDFSVLVQKKEFFDAYGMLEKAPYLNKTDSARKLELLFARSFAEAKKMLSADPLRNLAKAQELLKPFSLVTVKKEVIYSLLKNYEIYLKADLLIKEKRFREYFILTAEFVFLTKEEIYKKVCALAESSILKIQNMIDEGKYENAFLGIKQIIIFLPYKNQLIDMAKEIQLKQKLLELIRNDDVGSAYELVAKNPILESMPEFMEYDEAFDGVLSKAMVFVANGEIKRVQQTLLPYVKIDIFRPKIKDCVRQASFNKLASLLANGSLDAAMTIASFYAKEFGKDAEYKRLFKQYGMEP